MSRRPDMSECAACGALVSDEAKHTRWHKQLAVLLALLEQAQP